MLCVEWLSLLSSEVGNDSRKEKQQGQRKEAQPYFVFQTHARLSLFKITNINNLAYLRYSRPRIAASITSSPSVAVSFHRRDRID